MYFHIQSGPSLYGPRSSPITNFLPNLLYLSIAFLLAFDKAHSKAFLLISPHLNPTSSVS